MDAVRMVPLTNRQIQYTITGLRDLQYHYEGLGLADDKAEEVRQLIGRLSAWLEDDAPDWTI